MQSVCSRRSDSSSWRAASRFEERAVRPLLVEDAVRVLVANDLVVLHEVDAVHLEASERVVQLPERLFTRAPVDLGHEDRAVAVAACERTAHPPLALAVEVVPRVVQKIDAAVNRRADDADGQLLVHVLKSEVPAADAYAGDALAGRAQSPVRHLACGFTH